MLICVCVLCMVGYDSVMNVCVLCMAGCFSHVCIACCLSNVVCEYIRVNTPLIVAFINIYSWIYTIHSFP